ncbi:hypothetical protein L7F22_037534 [Adiantum nelumboides]|nr:hypothetical protein [Adiantum nelumboides]
MQPCARFEGCYFDHKKFLMACDEHLHHFLPRLPGHLLRKSSLNMGRIRFKRKVREWKKIAQRAAHLDAEAEEKWQEKAGVDEEFLRRERKRFQRDIARVAPVMVGGGIEEYKYEGWESMAGSNNVIQCMKEMVILPLLYPEAFARLAVSPPRGVLLHGHPGTGKTLAVKALVGACAKGHKQIAYFARKGADCLGKYAGDAERQLRMLFYLAEKHQPSIIFFDEIDGLAPTRSQHQDQTQKSVVSTLLALMDGIKSRGSVVVIGATNRPDALDPALRRPGRFDREIYFPLPSFLGRAAILTLLTKNWQMPPKKDVVTLLASKTIGFAGADLQALCAQAAINSLKRTVSVDDVMSSMEKQGKLPSFPDLKVSTVDWATALEQISPPCSWRSAKGAFNTVICAPLPNHILPELLWPMVELLISLHLDSRAVLPPVLNMLATKLEVTLKDSLGDSWIDQINASLLSGTLNSNRKELERNLEDIFFSFGMVADGNVTSIVPNAAYEGSKFRVMMSGKESAWLDHFAAWFMFGFEGFTEMCNLNLTTLLQEGGGDVVQGLIHILGSIQSKSPCVVYMPQLESWAVESVATDQVQEQAEERSASHCWNVFMQQVNLLPSSLQIIFVASSQMQKDDIPQEVVEFFWATSVSTLRHDANRSGESLLKERWLSFNRSSPCSWVEETLVHDMNKVFSRAADGFAGLFCQGLLCHGQPTNETCTMEPLNSAKHVSFAEVLEASSSLSPSDHAFDKDVSALSTLEGLNETGLKADSSYLSSMGTKSARLPGNQLSFPCSPEQSYLPIAISTVGYELLYHPELWDLRHATSKLQEGPSYNTVLSKTAPPESTDSSSVENDQVHTVTLKGLNAVGLLAYSGKYTKARDVAGGVQEVLELLMKRIKLKVSLGKDHEQFAHLFHKAASLQDKIFMWAHNLSRFDFAPNRPQANAVNCSDPKAKSGGDVDKLTTKIYSEMEETEGLPTPLVPVPPKMTSLADAVQGMQLDVQVPRTTLECNKTDPLVENSGKKLLFNGKTTKDKVNEVMAQWQIVDNTEMRKCCPSCLRLVKGALRRLFMRAWKSRGAVLSLSVADEVIATCASAVSVGLNPVLNCVSREFFHSANTSGRHGCCCRTHHRIGITTLASSSLINKSSNSKLLTCAGLDEDLTSSSYVCLCSLVEIIDELKF